jgi:hypothetical protein
MQHWSINYYKTVKWTIHCMSFIWRKFTWRTAHWALHLLPTSGIILTVYLPHLSDIQKLFDSNLGWNRGYRLSWWWVPWFSSVIHAHPGPRTNLCHYITVKFTGRYVTCQLTQRLKTTRKSPAYWQSILLSLLGDAISICGGQPRIKWISGSG